MCKPKFHETEAVLLLLILVVLSSLENKYISAQTQTDKILFVELLIPDGPNKKVVGNPIKFEVPNDFDFEKSLFYKATAKVDCLNCPLTSSFHFWLHKAERIEKAQTKISFDLYFGNKKRCNSKKEFTISQNKKETFELKCGVKITTYYALKDD